MRDCGGGSSAERGFMNVIPWRQRIGRRHSAITTNFATAKRYRGLVMHPHNGSV